VLQDHFQIISKTFSTSASDVEMCFMSLLRHDLDIGFYISPRPAKLCIADLQTVTGTTEGDAVRSVRTASARQPVPCQVASNRYDMS
jgi:hypothetical protein